VIVAVCPVAGAFRELRVRVAVRGDAETAYGLSASVDADDLARSRESFVSVRNRAYGSLGPGLLPSPSPRPSRGSWLPRRRARIAEHWAFVGSCEADRDLLVHPAVRAHFPGRDDGREAVLDDESRSDARTEYV
jgi:hypothetical protein